MTIETEERTELRGTRSAGLQFTLKHEGPGIFEPSTLRRCTVCRRHVEMVTPEHAAEITGLTTRTIYRWIEADALHFLEESGQLLICRSALTRHLSAVGGRKA